MKRLLRWSLILFFVPVVTFADSYAPSHYCSKPHVPYQFDSEWELENFNSEVEDYKRCIADFVEEQEEAIQAHREAAEEAIDEWNSFVNYELN